MNVTTSLALASTSVKVGVGFSVFVAAWTMSFCALLFGCDLATGQSAQTSSEVFLLSDSFKVLRVDAATDAAKMINLKSLWNLAYKQFISDSVCCYRTRTSVFISHLTVAVRPERCCPNPAARIRLWNAFLKESLHQRVAAGVLSLCHGFLILARIQITKYVI